ncbi:MAG: hypothetical protein OEV40_24545 [Acidimicrobiia bacterium]|nr:hypothetical protein [Acidimicrobiia bacterium]
MGERNGRITTTSSIELIGRRVVVVKRRRAIDEAEPAPNRPSLVSSLTEAEGRWLVAARHPDVVRVRRVTPAAGVLITDHAGLLTLRTCRLTLRAGAGFLAAVAVTVADLHRRGLVHGNLRLDHVIVAGADRLRPVLCSPAPPPRGRSADPAADVLALADLAVAVADRFPWAPRWRAVIDDLRCDGGVIGATGAARLFTGLEAWSSGPPVRLLDALAARVPAGAATIRARVGRG